ncbi:MAG: hypothetical protein LBD05_01725 [Mycoplasmataceae bacterium]|jgi:tetrahydromethanopterin S-methyltransferase subunit G|nr:hypothetical protein [Mycoplasmataceae bacterium]
MKNINKYTIISSLNNKNLEKDIIVLEKMNKSDNSNNKPNKPKQQSLREVVYSLAQKVDEGFKQVNERIDKIETIQQQQGKEINAIKTRIDKIDNKLETVIKLNDLKS